MVNILWSLSNGGTAVSSVSHGSKVNGEITTAKELYVRHDGGAQITNVGIFIRQFSGTYAGDATASADFSEILTWGDASTTGDYGGVQVNQNAVDSFPSDQWPSYTSKATTYGNTCRTGVGDSESNAIALSKMTYSSTGTDQVIAAGSTPNVRFQMRIKIPDNEDTIGIRQFEVMLAYTATS